MFRGGLFSAIRQEIIKESRGNMACVEIYSNGSCLITFDMLVVIYYLSVLIKQHVLPHSEHNTVNPLYNDFRHYSKIRFIVNLVCRKISGSCIFH